jgi:hypothetical protein
MPRTIDPATDTEILDAIADLSTETDEGPAALGISDEPAAEPVNSNGPNADDGEQDVSQDPSIQYGED